MARDVRADFRYRASTNPKKQPLQPQKQPGAQRRGARLKSRKIQSGPQTDFPFPPTFKYGTLPLSQCLRSARNVTSASIQRAALAAHRAKRLGNSTRWHTGGRRTRKMRLKPVFTPNYMIHTNNATRSRYARDTTALTSRLYTNKLSSFDARR